MLWTEAAQFAVWRDDLLQKTPVRHGKKKRKRVAGAVVFEEVLVKYLQQPFHLGLNQMLRDEVTALKLQPQSLELNGKTGTVAVVAYVRRVIVERINEMPLPWRLYGAQGHWLVTSEHKSKLIHSLLVFRVFGLPRGVRRIINSFMLENFLEIEKVRLVQKAVSLGKLFNATMRAEMSNNSDRNKLIDYMKTMMEEVMKKF